MPAKIVVIKQVAPIQFQLETVVSHLLVLALLIAVVLRQVRVLLLEEDVLEVVEQVEVGSLNLAAISH